MMGPDLICDAKTASKTASNPATDLSPCLVTRGRQTPHNTGIQLIMKKKSKSRDRYYKIILMNGAIEGIEM